ncbi:MAG: hypothetical protein J0H68_02720 [Sphingobacteriia bacterium]|nr:hypothetical protein [Sphingobacteriia bacterium]
MKKSLIRKSNSFLVNNLFSENELKACNTPLENSEDVILNKIKHFNFDTNVENSIEFIDRLTKNILLFDDFITQLYLLKMLKDNIDTNLNSLEDLNQRRVRGYQVKVFSDILLNIIHNYELDEEEKAKRIIEIFKLDNNILQYVPLFFQNQGYVFNRWGGEFNHSGMLLSDIVGHEKTQNLFDTYFSKDPVKKSIFYRYFNAKKWFETSDLEGPFYENVQKETEDTIISNNFSLTMFELSDNNEGWKEFYRFNDKHKCSNHCPDHCSRDTRRKYFSKPKLEQVDNLKFEKEDEKLALIYAADFATFKYTSPNKSEAIKNLLKEHNKIVFKDNNSEIVMKVPDFYSSRISRIEETMKGLLAVTPKWSTRQKIRLVMFSNKAINFLLGESVIKNIQYVIKSVFSLALSYIGLSYFNPNYTTRSFLKCAAATFASLQTAHTLAYAIPTSHSEQLKNGIKCFREIKKEESARKIIS